MGPPHPPFIIVGGIVEVIASPHPPRILKLRFVRLFEVRLLRFVLLFLLFEDLKRERNVLNIYILELYYNYILIKIIL